ncbi:MAG: serine/threonine protein kinase [Lachnospiraceae bacterium]|nr:serine/threonine protein kinase [Lachnospiraceae bacterium]
MKSWTDEYASVLPDVLAEAYEVCSCLKVSGGSASYLLREKNAEVLYILKTASDPVFCRLLANEKNILDKIHTVEDKKYSGRFPYAVQLYEDPTSKMTFYIRTYIEGKTLEELCEMNYEQPGLPILQALDYIISLTDTLQYLHSLTPPLIHRDIKPQNIVIDVDGVCHFIDFGISRFYQPGKDSDTLPMGTRLTAPPEQYGYQQCDSRSDLYSLGVVLFYALTGEYSLSDSLLDEIDQPVADVIRRATMFDPRNRYQSAGEMLDSLLAVRFPYVRQASSKQEQTGSPQTDKADRTETAPSENTAIRTEKDPSENTAIRTEKASPTDNTSQSGRRLFLSGILTGALCLALLIAAALLVHFLRSDSGRAVIPDTEELASDAFLYLPAEVISDGNTESGTEAVSDRYAESTADSIGEASPESEYAFTESLIEEAVREQLGLTNGEPVTTADLEQVTALHIIGLQIYSGDEEIWFQGDYPYVYDDEMRESGLYEETGTISSLEDLTHMPNLTTVCLYRQQITDISLLKESGLTLTELGLGYNPLTDLSPLEGNSDITILNLAGLDIQDASVIASLNNLRELNISATSIRSLDGLENCRIEELNLYQVSLSDYTVLGQLEELVSLEIDHLSEPVIQALGELSLETLFIHSLNGYSLGALSPLTTLKDLSVYTGNQEMISLEGMDFPALQSLDIKNATITDFYGLSSLTELSVLKIYSSVCKSYDGLDALPNLHTIYCTLAQAEVMRAQYPEMDFYYSYAE